MFAETDSSGSHIEDALIAGDGLCEPDAVSFIASHARHCVQWMIEKAVLSDKDTCAVSPHPYHLTRKGGHSQRQIVHSADATGKAVVTTLVNPSLHHRNITIIKRSHAVDLIMFDKVGLPGQ